LRSILSTNNLPGDFVARSVDLLDASNDILLLQYRRKRDRETEQLLSIYARSCYAVV